MLNTSVLCFLASYSCALLCELSQLKWKHAIGRIVAFLIGAAGLVAHTFYLFKRSHKTDLAPLLSSAYDWLMVLAWIVVLVFLFVSLFDRKLATGLIIWPVVLTLVVSAQWVSDSPRNDLDYHRGWKMLHASMLVLGTSAVAFGLVLSVLYLWQHRRLKHRQMANSSLTLPNLELIERLNRWSILVAVPLLTIGVVSGFALSINSKESDFSVLWKDPVVIGGAITSTLMGVLFFWLIMQKGSPGKRIAMLTGWSCGFLLVTLVGLEILIAAMGTHGVHGISAAQSAKNTDSAQQGAGPK